jgi:signal transduction histidine kinase
VAPHIDSSVIEPTRRGLPTALTGLSARLLVLTAVFVMLAEVAIYVPSIARFRMVYLEEKIASAHLASLALKAAPDYMVDEALKAELLARAGVHAIVLDEPERRLMLLEDDMPPKVDATFDLRTLMATDKIAQAFRALAGPERMIRVISAPPTEGHSISPESIELVMEEGPLRRAMIDYSVNILSLSIVISLITASLVYVALQALLVRPMRRITGAMMTFRKAPEAESSVIMPSGRSDELGLAEAELAAMQEDLRAALRQKTRLAALGTAVSKVNHDLRNILATAQLLRERLAASADPEVRRVTPALFRTIDRAIDLCTQTLAYGRAEEPAPKRREFALRELVEDVRLSVGLPDGKVAWCDDVAEDFCVNADRDQIFRVLLNLCRNAVQAMADAGGELTVQARRAGDMVEIEVRDTGAGLPDKARARLFEPFTGTARSGGTGLGLAIARDLARAHGGDVSLLRTGAHGTAFRIDLPAS